MLLCLSLCLTGCETLRSALTQPQPAPAVSADAQQAICPRIPKILTDPTRVPTVCKQVAIGDDYQACLEGLLGEPGKPETGAMGACNQDKADIRKRLEGDKQ